MNQAAKSWVRLELENGCISLYGMGKNASGEMLTEEGKTIKWAIRDSKPHEPWAFSITIAMSLAAVLKRPAETVAAELAQYLSGHHLGPWAFVSVKGYINASFKPKCLRDYLEGKDKLNWDRLKDLRGGSYAYYRLKVLKQALEVRGLLSESDFILDKTIEGHPFDLLFNYPERQPVHGGEQLELWESWLNEVSALTRLGYLRNLNNATEEMLLAFINACLS